jgi:hypothetical protein
MRKVDFSNKAPSKFIVTKQGFLKLFLQKELLKKLETINLEFERYSNEKLSLLFKKKFRQKSVFLSKLT